MNSTTIESIDPASPALDLARRLHETVAQRLVGLAYLLAADRQPSAELTNRCRNEVEAALGELRDVLSSVGRPEESATDPGVGVAAELQALLEAFPDVELRWGLEDGARVGPESLLENFLSEGLRNVRKHARPTAVTVEAYIGQGVVLVELANDGVLPRRSASCGVGRRLLEVEASLHGALVQSAPAGPGRWSHRLILPGD